MTTSQPLKLLILGAHPDDADYHAGALAAVARVGHFFGPAGLVLGALGCRVLGAAPPGPRGAHRAAIVAGLALLALRYVAPAVFRDAKEVELLTPPVAIASAAALAWLWERGPAARGLALLAAATALWWGVERGWAAYAGRFLAVGLS